MRPLSRPAGADPRARANLFAQPNDALARKAGMGRVIMKVRLTNDADAENCRRGMIPSEEVREAEIEALVDTGATMLVLPGSVVATLGLPERGRRKVRYADGRVAEVGWVGGIRLEILGREMTCDALVEPHAGLALIGQLQLEELDLIVDPKSRELRVNPASPDLPLLDLLSAAS